jgi:hypothetical protein
MNTMLVFPPGHAQVAVEAWPGTGEYFLIETTALPTGDINSCLSYKTKAQWNSYIQNCIVIDCNLTKELGIQPLSN